VPAWGLPKGSKFEDFFDPGSTKGRLNLARLPRATARLPRATHHNPKIKLKRNLCTRLQSEGECKPGCNLAHVSPSKMDEDTKKEAAKACKEAYEYSLSRPPIFVT
jgi:hypothetical protein